ncbi:MAG: segregation/condensation protein A [Candidatus Sungbacteria bacterium]|nr:segregation/condensation protein A [Candidatus Sungbacteria bacterium]
MFAVKQEKFEGPLDLLLELIKKEKLSINEISLAKVTDEYLTAVEKISKEGGVDQEQLAEFLVIAGELLLIKSRSLLPGYAAGEEEELSILDLERRLEALKKMREQAEKLGQIGRQKRFIFAREAYAGFESIFFPPPGLKVEHLRMIFLKVYAELPKIEKLAEERIKKIISLEEKIKELQELLSQKVERIFSELMRGGKEKAEVIVSFLALLELAKNKLVELHQDGMFGEIRIKGV